MQLGLKFVFLKQARSLGIRKIQGWNVVAMGRYTWAIASKKDTLWLKWINEVYVKQDNWWEYTHPSNSS